MLTSQNPTNKLIYVNKGIRHVNGARRHLGNIAHGSVMALTHNHAPSTFGGFFMPKEKIIAHDILRFVDGAFR